MTKSELILLDDILRSVYNDFREFIQDDSYNDKSIIINEWRKSELVKISKNCLEIIGQSEQNKDIVKIFLQIKTTDGAYFLDSVIASYTKNYQKITTARTVETIANFMYKVNSYCFDACIVKLLLQEGYFTDIKLKLLELLH